MRLQQRNTVRFVARGEVMRTGRIRAGETPEATADRLGIRLGSRNSVDGSVRLAEWGGWRGEARFAIHPAK